MNLINRKIFVTGAAGFIGMHTAKRLLDSGACVVGLDNLNSYYSTSLKYDRLAELGISASTFREGEVHTSRVYPDFRFLKADLENNQLISELFLQEKFDFVVHLAAQAGVRYSLDNPDAYVSSNIQGFMNILEGCRKNEIKHLVYASSSSVYGLNKETPFLETHNTDRPASLYAATKKANELMAHSYSHLFSLRTTGLRFFTVYGPWGRPDMALHQFTEKIANNLPIEVFGEGNMVRDFTYIDDVVEAVAACVTKYPEAGGRPPYDIFNVGNASPRPVLDYIRAIETALGKKAFMLMRPAHPADVQMTHADIHRLQHHIGYNPKTQVEAGVARFVKWFVEYYHRSKAEMRQVI